jgi:cytochrome P450
MLPILLYLLIIIILLILAIVYFKLIRPEKRVYDILHAQGINGEPFVPLLGQLSQLRRYRDADKMMVFHEELVQKHGNVYLYGFGPIVRLVINEPDLLAQVLNRNNAYNYIKPNFTTTIFTPLLGHHNLLVTEGDEHERARRMINPAFYHTNLNSMVSIINDRTAKTIQAILNKSDSSQEQQVDLQVLFNSLTLSIIASSAFGADLETNANAKDIMSRVLSDAMDAIIYRTMRMINQIPFLSKLPFWKKDIIDNGARKISEFVDQIIIDRRQGRSTSMSDGSDLLDLLLSAVDDDGQPFTDQEIKEQALTFVLAGSETTGNLMVWIFYILMTHDDVLQACQEEVDRVLPNGMEPTNEHLSELAVCEAIINETLRLYPSAPIFVRHCIREHTIGTERQLHIPVGADITVNSYVLHRRSDLWPRPLEFDYTRWMRDPKTGLKPKLPHPFAYLPFAAGPRNCIGQNFALLEARLMLAMLVQRCNFKIIPGQKIVPDLIITLRTKYGLLANITKRQI